MVISNLPICWTRNPKSLEISLMSQMDTDYTVALIEENKKLWLGVKSVKQRSERFLIYPKLHKPVNGGDGTIT